MTTCQKPNCHRTDTTMVTVNDRGGYKLFCPDHASTAAEVLAKCKTHGPMELRPTERQTPEQQWCGTWYDCADPWCRSSTLIPSAELLATRPAL